MTRKTAQRAARRVRHIALLLLVAALSATCAAGLPRTDASPWRSPGLIGNGGWPFTRVAVTPEEAAGASYVPGSAVLMLPDGRARLIPFGGGEPLTLHRDDPRVADAVRSDQAWLASGTVPGATAQQREAAARALLDLRMLTLPNGASTASWYGAWNYVWPRDGAFAVAAFAATGHGGDAQRVLYFLARTQAPTGLWAARYRPDGTAVTDGREVQLDSLGWVLWATWFLHEKDPRAANLDTLWPMVRRAADRSATALRADGLPPPSPDYWERSPSREQAPHAPTLGVCAPMLAGLRAAAALATDRGDAGAAQRWDRAADRLSAAIERRFAPYGYPRSPIRGGAADASVTFLAPPFATPAPGVLAAVARIRDRLRLAGGGAVPGEAFGASAAWTPETGLFALEAAAIGDRAGGRDWLGWLIAHRTSLGSFPEKVDARGRQAGVAPLGWTSALVVLSLATDRSALPVPPG
ncbi:glycoside hydrolase family 15 [Actinoallomurus purpureus]|uniref:glycoside hydrolase family 15 protein n=1 Tax=Actinoallomurus purpureus TaxID=478114 RepID=UPI002092E0DE|nr:glycoside hydrolase family 15 protein [Actinoallomurus purpureus]MCO6004696.1 glycoside hydrolase family 15 [Actinoallomurus purpureus]